MTDSGEGTVYLLKGKIELWSEKIKQFENRKAWNGDITVKDGRVEVVTGDGKAFNFPEDAVAISWGVKS